MPTFELTSPEGKKYRVEGPEGATPEQAYDILQKQLASEPVSGGQQYKNFGTGILKGLAGDVVGAGQLLDPVGQAVAPSITTSIEKAGKPFSDWTMAPSSGFAETAGNVVGGALPFLAAPEAALGSLARRAGFGALAGGLQPTRSGSPESHLVGMAGGALGGATLAPKAIERGTRFAQGAGTLAALEALGRRLGVSPWMVAEAVGLPLWWTFRRPTTLSKLAAGQAARIPAQASGAAGAAAGQGVEKLEETSTQPNK